MNEKLQIIKAHIDEEKRELTLQLEGQMQKAFLQDSFRFSAIFQGENQNRYYPMIAAVNREEEGKITFVSSAKIELPYVFMDYKPEKKEEISLRFAYCDLKEKWVEFSEEISLPSQFFQKEVEPKNYGKKLFSKIAYVFLTLLLPIWLLDGYLACKGKKKLHNAAKGMQGKKAILYHAHGIVYEKTGYGYSIREIKTNYFKRQYEKACRKISKTEGVLFLSERRVEKGGNLDLIRNAFCREKKWKVSEFLTTLPVHKQSWSQLKESAKLIAKAKVVVLEDFYPQLHALTIREDTKIVQMWHACGAFKLFGLSELGVVEHLKQSTRNHRNYDIALTSSVEIAPFYSEAFGISKSHVKPIGVPRTDIFFDSSYGEKMKEELLEKYPVCQGKKVVLFAPTFRGSGNKTAYFPKDKFPVNEIMRALPEDVVLIVKNHPFVKQTYEVAEAYKERLLDLSANENINDLLFITDLLITDYSSVIFEASLLKIPMLFYAFDLQQYLKERNLYFDFASFVPGEIVWNCNELIETIRKCLSGNNVEEERYIAFQEFFLSSLDGKSTQRTVSLIEELLK